MVLRPARVRMTRSPLIVFLQLKEKPHANDHEAPSDRRRGAQRVPSSAFSNVAA
jgi:hypothetical protein